MYQLKSMHIKYLKEDENLINIGNQMSIPESLRLLEKVKTEKKKFRDFMNQKPTFIRKKTEEILH